MGVTVQRAQVHLTSSEPLGKGAAARVFDVRDVDGHPWPGRLVYKEYKPTIHSKHPHTILMAERAVRFRDQLAAGDRQYLDDHTTWPFAIVKQDRQTVGVLMPRVPDDFFMERPDPKSAGTRRILLDAQWLALTAERRKAIDPQMDTALIPLDDIGVRLVFLAKISFILAILHKHGVVYGDLSFPNLAVSSQSLDVKLMDCDAVAVDPRDRHHLVNSPMFHIPPATPPLATQEPSTDVFKIALVAVRWLSPSTVPGSLLQLRSTKYLHGRVDPVLLRSLEEALDPDPRKRPDSAALYSCLYSAAVAANQPPELSNLSLSSDVVLLGQDVLVEWLVEHADQMVVELPGMKPLAADLGSCPAGMHVRPQHSGPVWVEASSKRGKTRGSAGHITVFELPPPPKIDLGLPGLRTPDLPGVAVPDLPDLHVHPAPIEPPHVSIVVTSPDLTSLSPDLGADRLQSALASAQGADAAVQRVTGALLDGLERLRRLTQDLTDARLELDQCRGVVAEVAARSRAGIALRTRDREALRSAQTRIRVIQARDPALSMDAAWQDTWQP